MSAETDQKKASASADASAGPLPAEAGTAGPAETSERDARELAEASRESEWTRPSFAKGLYMGRFELDLIHPHPLPSPSERGAGDAFLAALEEYARTMDGARIERDAKIPDEYIDGLAKLGTFGMKIPVAYGGLGLSLLYYGRALMLLGSVHPSLGALLSAHQSIGVPEPVKVFGTDEQKREYLPPCAAG